MSLRWDFECVVSVYWEVFLVCFFGDFKCVFVFLDDDVIDVFFEGDLKCGL